MRCISFSGKSVWGRAGSATLGSHGTRVAQEGRYSDVVQVLALVKKRLWIDTYVRDIDLLDIVSPSLVAILLANCALFPS